MSAKLNLSGETYGRLFVVREAKPRYIGKAKRKQSYFVCKCKCGTVTEVSIGNLRNGSIQSCGCLHREVASKTMRRLVTTHGLTDHPLFVVWDSINQRCYNRNHKDYTRYGGRGIRVCKEWKADFQAFYDWATSLPPDVRWKKGCEIDRKKNNLHYSPDNCHFVTRIENCRNRRDNVWVPVPRQLTKKDREWLEEHSRKFGNRVFRVSQGVEEMLLIDLWDLHGQSVSYGTAKMRVSRGWSVWDSVSLPPQK